MFKKILYIVKLSRLKFLIYSPIFYTIGVLIAYSETQAITNSNYLYGLFFVLNTHMMTHFYNEFYDFLPDCNNNKPSPWTGGSRVLVEKRVDLKTCLLCAYVSTILSLIYLIFCPSFISLLIGLLIVLLAWGYSAPPLKLEYRGMGELDVAVVLNILVPLWGYTLQEGHFNQLNLLYFLIPLAGIEYSRMMIMNMPDRASDKLSNKTTLVVRLGIQKSVKICTLIMTLSYIGFFLFWGSISNKIIYFISLSLPLAFWLMFRLARGDWRTHKSFYTIPFLASILNGGVGALYLLGLIISYKGSFSPYDLQVYPLFVYLFSLLYFFLAKFRSNLRSQIW